MHETRAYLIRLFFFFLYGKKGMRKYINASKFNGFYCWLRQSKKKKKKKKNRKRELSCWKQLNEVVEQKNECVGEIRDLIIIIIIYYFSSTVEQKKKKKNK